MDDEEDDDIIGDDGKMRHNSTFGKRINEVVNISRDGVDKPAVLLMIN